MTISRRVLIGRFGAVVGAAALAPRRAAAQGAQAVPSPPPFDTHRDYNPTADPVSYPDPDVVVVDIRADASSGMAAIERLRAGHPTVAIFAVAGNADSDLILQAAGQKSRSGS